MNQYPNLYIFINSTVYLSNCRVTFFLQDTGIEKPCYRPYQWSIYKFSKHILPEKFYSTKSMWFCISFFQNILLAHTSRVLQFFQQYITCTVPLLCILYVKTLVKPGGRTPFMQIKTRCPFPTATVFTLYSTVVTLSMVLSYWWFECFLVGAGIRTCISGFQVRHYDYSTNAANISHLRS